MNRMDCQPALPHFMPVAGSKQSVATQRVARIEQHSTAHWTVEPAEENAGNWESAWIDLGGEG